MNLMGSVAIGVALMFPAAVDAAQCSSGTSTITVESLGSQPYLKKKAFVDVVSVVGAVPATLKSRKLDFAVDSLRLEANYPGPRSSYPVMMFEHGAAVQLPSETCMNFLPGRPVDNMILAVEGAENEQPKVCISEEGRITTALKFFVIGPVMPTIKLLLTSRGSEPMVLLDVDTESCYR